MRLKFNRIKVLNTQQIFTQIHNSKFKRGGCQTAFQIYVFQFPIRSKSIGSKKRI